MRPSDRAARRRGADLGRLTVATILTAARPSLTPREQRHRIEYTDGRPVLACLIRSVRQTATEAGVAKLTARTRRLARTSGASAGHARLPRGDALVEITDFVLSAAGLLRPARGSAAAITAASAGFAELIGAATHVAAVFDWLAARRAIEARLAGVAARADRTTSNGRARGVASSIDTLLSRVAAHRSARPLRYGACGARHALTTFAGHGCVAAKPATHRRRCRTSGRGRDARAVGAQLARRAGGRVVTGRARGGTGARRQVVLRAARQGEHDGDRREQMCQSGLRARGHVRSPVWAPAMKCSISRQHSRAALRHTNAWNA